jgi:hypothetical protein
LHDIESFKFLNISVGPHDAENSRIFATEFNGIIELLVLAFAGVQPRENENIIVGK